MENKITVLIPTKNRAEYLKHTLKTCEVQDYGNIEIIVCDDGSNDKTREIVMDFAARDSRIRYELNKWKPGMLDNFEYALTLPNEGFVIMLGGDDALLPSGAVEINDLINQSGFPLITWPAPVFSYPEVRNDDGQLVIPREKGWRIVRSEEYLNRQIKSLNYLADTETPMFYVKGIVSLALINKVKNSSPGNRFYSSHTPDGFSGIALANEVDNFYYSSRPFSMHGLSPASQGLAYLANDVKSKEISRGFFDSVSEIKMHPELAAQPYSPLITLMTADYLLRVGVAQNSRFKLRQLDYGSVVDKAIAELCHGAYGGDRLGRELEIIKNIAHHHNLDMYFDRVMSSARKMKNEISFAGNGISPKSIFLSAKSLRLRNVVDASMAAEFIYNAYDSLTVSEIAKGLYQSVLYKLKSVRRGGKLAEASACANI